MSSLEPPVRQLVRTALGQEPPDSVIINSTLVNVYTGELRSPVAILVKHGLIAAVVETSRLDWGDGVRIINADGFFAVPGFLDSHTHCDSFQTPGELARHALLHGTTVLITEVYHFANALGPEGVAIFLSETERQPLHIYAVAPTITYLRTHNGHGLPRMTSAAMRELLSHDRIVGMGELAWPYVTEHRLDLLELMDYTYRLRKTVEGHGAGAAGSHFTAFAAAGVDSCHEPITASEVLARLRAGMWVFIREGSIRRELAQMGEVARGYVNLRRLGLCSDTMFPHDMLAHGYMDHIVEEAVRTGFSPIQAIQMATINPAQHFGLQRMVGGIAPGRSADILLVRDLGQPRPEFVMVKGQVVVENARLSFNPPASQYPRVVRRMFEQFPVYRADDFVIHGGRPLRVVHLARGIITERKDVHLPAGPLHRVPPDSDLVLATVINRHNPARKFTGLVRGFGLTAGAAACSISFDTSDIVAIGTSTEELAASINHMCGVGGGIVVAARGQRLAELPLPIAGIESDLSFGEIARRFTAIDDAFRTLGSTHENPLLALRTLTFFGIPHIRLSDDAYYMVSRGEKAGLYAE